MHLQGQGSPQKTQFKIVIRLRPLRHPPRIQALRNSQASTPYLTQACLAAPHLKHIPNGLLVIMLEGRPFVQYHRHFPSLKASRFQIAGKVTRQSNRPQRAQTRSSHMMQGVFHPGRIFERLIRRKSCSFLRIDILG